MPFGIVPARGHWDHWTCDTTSTATFLKGDLVAFNGARTLVRMTSINTTFLGVAEHDSVNSLPTGKVSVAVPVEGCTAFVDVPTGLTASALSRGQSYGLGSDATRFSFLTTLAVGSYFSRYVTVVGPCDSALSRIEVMFQHGLATYYSTSSASIA